MKKTANLLTAVAGLITALLGVAAWNVTTTTVVPDVSGRTLARATRMIEDQELRAGADLYLPLVPPGARPGRVFRTDPPAHTKVRKGDLVELVLAPERSLPSESASARPGAP